MVDEKTHPILLVLALVSNILHTRAFGTRIQLHYLLEQERVIWTRFFIHHSNGPFPYIVFTQVFHLFPMCQSRMPIEYKIPRVQNRTGGFYLSQYRLSIERPQNACG